MLKRTWFATAFLTVALTATAAAQAPLQRISVEPYVGYGFYGGLPGENARLESTIAYGARGAYQLSPQWAVFGDYRRSNPRVEEATLSIPGGNVQVGQDLRVDHWAAGVEFSYVPRGGAEGMLPVVLEAGLGQARYQGGNNDLAVKLGASSALRLSPNLALRYGVDNFVSNYRGDQGVTNQFFARVGAELRF